MPRILKAVELAALARLREGFLTGANSGGAYWRDENDLALYDGTFAERIGWKWDAVIEDLGLRGWRPQSRRVVDFGCGSGVAGRRVLAAWDGFESLTLTDVSPLATAFAASRAREEFAAVSVSTEAPADAEDALLLV